MRFAAGAAIKGGTGTEAAGKYAIQIENICVVPKTCAIAIARVDPAPVPAPASTSVPSFCLPLPSVTLSVRACVAVRVPVFCGYALGLTAMRPKPNKQAKRQQPEQQKQQQNEPENVAQWQIAGATQMKPQ